MLLSDYSRQLYIGKAKELLRDKDYILQLIAIKAGFFEGSNFQSAFKRLGALSPGRMEKKMFPEP